MSHSSSTPSGLAGKLNSGGVSATSTGTDPVSAAQRLVGSPKRETQRQISTSHQNKSAFDGEDRSAAVSREPVAETTPAAGPEVVPEVHPAQHIGLVNDYLVIPYANGSSFASQFLFRELRRTGHEVTVVGPHDSAAASEELPPKFLSVPSLPVRGHPGLKLGMPSPNSLKNIGQAGFDAIIAQTGSALLELGLWARRAHGIPFLAVYVFHVPSYYEVLLPEKIRDWKLVRYLFQGILVPFSERVTASVYNESDGLIVLADSFEQYWRERGVTVPITVIPRCIDPDLFQRRTHADPYESRAKRGSRLLCVCRHSPEKNIERLLRIFAEEIAPNHLDATLTLVGDGQDSDDYRKLAQQLGIAERTFFPGEMPVNEMAAWYQHANVFTYSSLSETYGQVVTEAMWFGLSVVALDDQRGVSAQIQDSSSGFLIDPGQSSAEQKSSNAAFAARVLELLGDSDLRSQMSQNAVRLAESRSNPDATIQRYRSALAAAHAFSTTEDRKKGFLKRLWALSRWSCVHLMALVFGALRAPTMKRPHGRRHPFWTRVDAVSPRAVKPESKKATDSPVVDGSSVESPTS